MHAMKKVLIPTKLEKICAETLKKHGPYSVVQDDTVDAQTLAKGHPDAYALIVRSEEVTAAVMDSLPNLKVVIRAGAGYNTIDTKHARKKGIDVMNTPGANANAVAEEVVALMLADCRHLVKADPSCRAGEWEKKAFMGREVSGKTVGIVGLGNIGRLVAKLLSGFNCRLLGYDPMISRERAAESGVDLVELDVLFAEADFVTLHLPETKETKGLVGAALLGKMKTGATLINCARAGVLDEAALRAVKKEKALRFLNDVYPKDEPGPKSVADIADLMVPHLGASTKEANSNAARRAAEQLIEYDDKGVTSYVVNRDIPEGLDESYCELTNTLARVCRQLVGREAKVSAIETSFYGSLQAFADWLVVPIVAALWQEFQRSMDSKAAVRFLAERGIEYRTRPTDQRKGFASSITVDMVASVDASNLKQVSVRGTVAENTLMISRINEFDKLYFEPHGHTAFFQYKDRPGVVGRIGAAVAEAGINIEDIRHSHHVPSDQSLAILKLNKPLSDAAVAKIGQSIEALLAFSVTL
jgi:D-3-phosphoglycerate dehydrogenase